MVSSNDMCIRNRSATKINKMIILHLMMTIVGTTGSTTGKNARIVESNYSNDDQGNYEYWIEQSDGIILWQTGRRMHTEDNKSYIQVTGGHLYIDGKNLRRIVSFVADHNGYRPTIGEVVLELPDIPPRLPIRLLAGASG